MSEWKKLEDVVKKIIGGGTPSRKNEAYYQGNIPWATVKDLVSTAINDTQEKITLQAIQESATNLIPKGNVIIATRMALGKAFINEVDIAINQDLKALIPNKEKVIPKYLLYAYLSNKEKIEGLGSGTTVKGVRLEQVNKLEIFVPSLEEQKKITFILSSVDQIIEKTKAIIKQTEQVKKGLMQQLLTKGIGHTKFKETEVGEIPEGWEVKSLNELLEQMTDYVANGSFQSLRENVSVFDEKGYAYYVRLYDLRLGIGHTSQKYVDKKSYEFLSKSSLRGNELLIANIGANVGEVFIMPKVSKPSTIAPNMIVMRVNEKNSYKYLYYYLSSQIGQKVIQVEVSGSGQPKLNKTGLKTVLVASPSLEEQQEIANILSSLEIKINIEKKKLEKLQFLKKGLMQSLLTGQVRVKIDETEVERV
ncbi:hypothetical protein COC98_16635 [Bacillus anthracis]|nr:hypothetical protein COC98_16635 [Bacillus anthracis]